MRVATDFQVACHPRMPNAAASGTDVTKVFGCCPLACSESLEHRNMRNGPDDEGRDGFM